MEQKDFPKGYLATMIRNKREDLKVLFNDDHKVLLIPIWECLYKEPEEKKELETRNKEIISLRKDVEVRDSELISLRNELEREDKEISHITNSISYRIGRTITWLPREVRKRAKIIFNSEKFS